MSGKCTQKGCDFPKGECLEGHEVAKEGCTYYIQIANIDILSEENNKQSTDNVDLIVNENNLYTTLTKWPEYLPKSLEIHVNAESIANDDLAYFDINSIPARYFNFLGFSNSGKTSLLLTYIYELRKSKTFKFLGSSSLIAWDTLLQRTEWEQGNPPRVPKPTAHESHLHTLVQHDNNFPIDIILSDIAGEEVSDWANLDINIPNDSKITKWLKRANIILLCLDLGELYENDGMNQWAYLSLYRKLLEKLKFFLSENEDIRVILLETKSDLLINNEINIAHKQARDLTQENLSFFLLERLEVASLVQLNTSISHTDRILEIIKYDPSIFKNPFYKSFDDSLNKSELHTAITEWIQ
ncbi:TRAFAC clade GTPase domain-containing protein [Acinetobacter pittii]|uniref:TRAFAC clade GTPase domain-containing protein n=1 Tax=Acinetobacter pittii TaxID=48296 RepID=UPI00192B5D1E|nr:hypothetical protein [Acinetobacter pittii]